MLELRSGVEYLQSETLVRHQSKLEQLAEALFELPFIKKIAAMAHRAGLDVNAIPYNVPYVLGVKRTFLRINEHICGLHHIQHLYVHPKAKRGKAPLGVPLRRQKKTDFIIAHVAIKGYAAATYVIPSATLHGVKVLYFPLEPTSNWPGRKPIIDYAKYKEAWHLLA